MDDILRRATRDDLNNAIVESNDGVVFDDDVGADELGAILSRLGSG